MSLPHKDQLCVYLFGAFRIESGGHSIRLPTRKTESLLAYLILHPGAHSREKLATLFWGDSSDVSARGSLRKALTLLRKNIDEKVILSDRENVELNPAFPIQVDVIKFEQQAANFLANPSFYQYINQCDLYQGDLLRDVYDDWVSPLREKYRLLYLDVLLSVVACLRAESEYKLAMEHAQKILAVDPSNERAHQHLMFCHITLGSRNKALQQYETCRQALQNELSVEPMRETQALYRWIKQSVPDTQSLMARVTNLPIPISSFVGRQKELARVKQLLSNARLVTLTGAGGSGKTRLAIHAATDLLDSFKDGIWWVELASLTDPSLVPSAIVKALGIDSRSDRSLKETLQKFLRTRQLLLVLDNCEHLIDACAQLMEFLLTSCAELKVLATSRETLDLFGEVVWQVPTLSLPDVQSINSMDSLMQYEGIRLFVERAVAVNPDFIPSDEDVIAITQICQRLDGIPLAIELAAARIKTMFVNEISERLADEPFQLLTDGNRTAQERHQTIRAAVDWSYDLLTESERQLFSRLSVFTGGWTLDAAETVCSGDGIEEEVIPELLTRLVDKSLVTINSGSQRYGMFETLRQYGREKLAQEGRLDWMFQRYLEYYLKMADLGDEKIRGPEQLDWFKWFEIEHSNLSNAMKGALNCIETVEKGCKLICSICWYWSVTGDRVVMKYWLDMAYSNWKSLENPITSANLLFNAGFHSVAGLSWLEPVDAQSILEQSLAIWNELGSDFILQQTQCLLILGWIQKYYFNNDDGYAIMNKAIHDFQEMGNVWWQAWGLNLWGGTLVDSPNPEHTLNLKEILEETITVWEKTGDECISSVVFWDYGTLAMEQGDLVEAQNYFQKALQRYRKFGANSWISSTLVYLGDNARALKQYDLAKSYYQENLEMVPFLLWDGGFAQICLGLGWVNLSRGNIQDAKEYFLKALNASLEFDFKIWKVRCMAAYAVLAVVDGNLCFASRLFGASCSHYERLKPAMSTNTRLKFQIDRMDYEEYLELCKDRMNKAEFEKTWNEGSVMSLDDVIDEIEKFRG